MLKHKYEQLLKQKVRPGLPVRCLPLAPETGVRRWRRAPARIGVTSFRCQRHHEAEVEQWVARVRALWADLACDAAAAASESRLHALVSANDVKKIGPSWACSAREQ